MKSSKAVRKSMRDDPELTDEYLEQSPNEDEYIPKKTVVNVPATLNPVNRMAKTPSEKVLYAPPSYFSYDQDFDICSRFSRKKWTEIRKQQMKRFHCSPE